MTASRRLLSYAARYKGKLLLGMACVCGANLFKAVGPVVMERVVDHLTRQVTQDALPGYSLLLIAIALVQGALLFGQEQLLLGTARHVECDLRAAFFAHLQKLPLEFFQANSTGDLMARSGNDLTTAVTGTSQALMFSANSVFALLVILPLMLRLSASLTLLALVPLLLVIAATLFLQKRMRLRFEQVQEQFGKISSRVQTALSAARTIRAFTQERAEIEAFRHLSRQFVGHSMRRTRLSGALFPILQFFIGLSLIAVLWYGGNLVAAGRLTIGQFLEAILYLGYLAWPMHVLGWQITVFQRGVVCMERVNSILSLEPSIQDSPRPLNSAGTERSIRFRDVTFRYKGADRPALDRTSFQVEPGQTVALVGAMGAGKSTLMNMILRLLDPGSGEIQIGGHSVRRLPLSVLRSLVGYVPQQTFLFSGSIAENIAFGKPDASEREIVQAAIRAGIADDIASFPMGYHTPAGEKGIALSGGQRQRIGIARAILREPEILLLDDALSSVDLHTEAKVMAHLRHLMKGRICLISSHRISTVRDADLIVVLHKGRIAEKGSHSELLARMGLYARMYEKQLLEEDLASG